MRCRPLRPDAVPVSDPRPPTCSKRRLRTGQLWEFMSSRVTSRQLRPVLPVLLPSILRNQVAGHVSV